jgi:hypothetical protein
MLSTYLGTLRRHGLWLDHSLGQGVARRSLQARVRLSLVLLELVADLGLVRPVTFRRMREPSRLQPSEMAPTQVPFAASR